MTTHRHIILYLVVLLCLTIGTAEARTKTDVVRLDNGDTMTGEIKQMLQGLMSVKTTYLKGTVSLKWIHVEQIESDQLFEVEVSDGTKYFGSITAADADLTMKVVTINGDFLINHNEVIRIAPMDERFWERLRGDVDLGISAKRANEERQFNLSGSATYRTRKYRVTTNLNSFVSRYGENPSTERHDLGFGYRRTLGNKWFWSALSKFEQNQELGLDLRFTLGGGGGRFIIQNNRSELSWTAGVAANEEWYAGAEAPETNIEGALALEYRFFLFADRETSISIQGAALPSLSSSNRIRYSLDAKFRYEFIKDLYFAVGLVADYDSEPPTGAEGMDWNFTTSMGYTF